MNLNYVKKLMDRKKTSHKGENGYALVIGGSEEYVGALTLAGLSALRAGCDAVTLASSEKVAWAANRYAPDLMTMKLRGETFSVKNAKEMVKSAERFDAVLVGCGMTRRGDKFVHYFIRKCMKPKVIDADALKSLSFKDFSNSILTPNEKAEVLQGNLRYFLQNDNVLLVKGATDIIISKNKIAYNRTGNQGMTKTGTGDVLAGLTVGFLAKSQDLFKSAVAASYINGFIGDQLLKQKKGYCFIASDIMHDLVNVQKMVKK